MHLAHIGLGRTILATLGLVCLFLTVLGLLGPSANGVM